jgi:hypothetical protein
VVYKYGAKVSRAPHEIQSKGEIHHMTQMQNAQSVALQLEKVRDKLPLLCGGMGRRQPRREQGGAIAAREARRDRDWNRERRFAG